MIASLQKHKRKSPAEQALGAWRAGAEARKVFGRMTSDGMGVVSVEMVAANLVRGLPLTLIKNTSGVAYSEVLRPRHLPGFPFATFSKPHVGDVPVTAVGGGW